MHGARNTLIPVLVALLAAIGAYVYIFLEVQSAGREAQSVEQKIEEEHERARRRDAVRTTLDDTALERTELEGRLLTENTLVSFFERLESLALEAGVSMEIGRISESIELDLIVPEGATGTETKPTRDPASDLLEWLEMDVNADGSWAQVYRFLAFVELLEYETKLSNIRLTTVAPQAQAPAADGEAVDAPMQQSSPWSLSLTLRVLKFKAQ